MVIIWHNGKPYSDSRWYFVDIDAEDLEVAEEFAVLVKTFRKDSAIKGVAERVDWRVDSHMTLKGWVADLLESIWYFDDDELRAALGKLSAVALAIIKSVQKDQGFDNLVGGPL